MKRIFCAILCLTVLLAGCGDSSSGLSESQLYEMEFDTNKYDSHIVYAVEGTNTEKELTEVAKQLEQRIERCFAEKNDDHPSISHQTQTNHADKTVTIYFNNTADLSQQFLEFTAAPNKVELKKGDKADGEIMIAADEFYDAYAQQDKASGNGAWSVAVKLTNNGRTKFEKAVKQAAGKGEQVTLWLDGKALGTYAAEKAVGSGGIITVTGSELIDKQAAWELAYRLRSGYIENKVTVKECSVKEKTQAA